MPRRPRPYACLGTTTHTLTQVAGPNPHQVAGPNPNQVAGSNPHQVAGPNPNQAAGPNPHQAAGPNPNQAAGPNPHQVADKPADGLDERRLSPWERGASLAEGSLHAGLRLPALGISWASSVEPGCTPL